MNLSKSEGGRILRKLEKISDYHTKADKEAHDIKDILANATSAAPAGGKSSGGTSRRRGGTPRGRKPKERPHSSGGGGADSDSGSD